MGSSSSIQLVEVDNKWQAFIEQTYQFLGKNAIVSRSTTLAQAGQKQPSWIFYEPQSLDREMILTIQKFEKERSGHGFGPCFRSNHSFYCVP